MGRNRLTPPPRQIQSERLTRPAGIGRLSNRVPSSLTPPLSAPLRWPSQYGVRRTNRGSEHHEPRTRPGRALPGHSRPRQPRRSTSSRSCRPGPDPSLERDPVRSTAACHDHQRRPASPLVLHLSVVPRTGSHWTLGFSTTPYPFSPEFVGVSSPRGSGNYTIHNRANGHALTQVATPAEAIAIAIDRIPAALLQTSSEVPTQDS
ncbi:DUF6193 family natural product biosynthesis protein [Nonomuraea indica]|uniref:DUF6193 family natural product biosynthesis protein n=1 Tax=Nonomuraea indica TaxID=1581193 RepID=A0ABW8A949_9ACTN